jgi:hypothetical protein
MAIPEFSSQEQEAVFRLLVALNGSLSYIVTRLEELAANKILSSKYLSETLTLTQNVQEFLDKKSHS